jgi:hypothetical protein
MGTKRFRIYGQVRGAQSARGLPGLEIRALDKDLCFDDRLGTAITDKKGQFEIRYDESDFRDFFELKPDIYLQIRAPDGALLYTTEDRVRYEAHDTERFRIEIPETDARIADGEALRRSIVDDPALQQELADAVSGLLADKHLLDSSLAYTFVPLVGAETRVAADLFTTWLGPQPEPPDLPAYQRRSWINPQPEPPGQTWVKEAVFEPDPEPWCVRWWWTGLPMPELLVRLERYRIADLAAAEDERPAGTAGAFAYRIMSDAALVRSLSQQIDAVLGRHGVVLAAGMEYSFVPVVYAAPGFAAQALAPAAAMPRIIDRAGQTTAPAWVHPLEGVPPADLLRQLAELRGLHGHSMEQRS